MAGVLGREGRAARGVSARRLLPAALTPYPYVLPALLVIVAVMAYPFLYAIWLSFQSTPSYTTATTFTGISNYVSVLTSALFGQTLLNTVVWTVSSTVLGMFFGLGAALLLDRVGVFRGPLRAILMLPYIVGYVVASYAWLWLYQGEYGFINLALMSLHITHQPVVFLGSLTWALPAVILVNVWKTFPFAMIMMIAGLQGIPEHTILAARLDGAPHWNIFWEVKLPYLRRVLVVTLMLLSFQNFNTFTIPYIMTGGGPLHHTEIVSNFIYNTAFTNLNFGQASAASVLVVAMLMVFAVFYVRSLGRDQEVSR